MASTRNTAAEVVPTLRLTCAVRVKPPPLPVMVMVEGPAAVPADAAKVTVLVVPVTDAGLKVTVTPAG